MRNPILSIYPVFIRFSGNLPVRTSWPGSLLLLTLLIFSELLVCSQATDYRKIFGSDWEEAEEFIRDNEPWMRQMSGKFNVSYTLSLAVVFPELVRYSALRDRMEQALLKTLYISLGDEYADFSVGRFQMKPSFAEAINENARLLKGRLAKFFPDQEKYKPGWKYRSAVVKYLENMQSQYLYLIAFMKICARNFDLSEMNEEEKVKFLSTAYNFSFQKSFAEVKSMIDRKFFTTKLVAAEYYSYSDISLAWYRLQIKDQGSPY